MSLKVIRLSKEEKKKGRVEQENQLSYQRRAHEYWS